MELPNVPAAGTEKAAGRLEILVREVDALRSALAEMESRSEYSPRSNDVEDAEERHALQMDPPARILSATAVARLRRQNATLRGAPTSRSQPGDRTYRLQPIEGSNETNEIAEEPAQVRP